MTAQVFLDATCTFFGGAYDSATKTYRSPTVAGIGVVRRAWAREDNAGDYFLNMPTGTATGCIVVFQIPDIIDGPRVAVPAIQGRRFVRYGIEAHCFFLSQSLFVEDCQDAVYALRDAITVKIRTDPTLGTGGFEAGNFDIGEGDVPITTHIEQGGNVNGLTKAYMKIDFEAHAYEVG